MKAYFRRFFFYYLPASLILLTNDKFNIQFSKNPLFNSYIKLACLLLGTLVSLVVVQVFTEKEKKKNERLLEALKGIIGELRKIVNIELGKNFSRYGVKTKGVDDLKLSIRIFLPKKRTWRQIFNKELFFEMYNYPSLYIKDVDYLCFQVSPRNQMQGLVGQAYNMRRIRYDFAINENHGYKLYNLDEQQLDVTSYCQFAIAAPIFKHKDSKKVIAIVTFDSEVKVDQPKNRQWEDVIRTYCKIIHKNYAILK